MHCVHHFVIRHLPHYCSHHHHPLALLFLLLFSHWCSQCFPAHWASWYRRAVMAQPPPGPCSATPSGPQTTPQQQQTTTGASCAQKACTAHADQLLLRGSQCRTAAAGMRQRAKTGATTSDARIETVKSPVTAWTSLVKSGSGPSKLQGQGRGELRVRRSRGTVGRGTVIGSLLSKRKRQAFSGVWNGTCFA